MQRQHTFGMQSPTVHLYSMSVTMPLAQLQVSIGRKADFVRRDTFLVFDNS